MLQTIRDRTQGWFAGIIIFVLILSFALWGISSYFSGSGNNNVVAKVNGVVITKSQLAATYERMRRQLLAQYGVSNTELNAKIENNLKQQALQTLISMQALKQASYKQNYRVSSLQVDNYLASIPDFRINGQFSMERFQQILTSTLLSVPEFLDLIHANLLIEQPRLGIIFTSFALPNEISESYSLVEQTRDINYAVLPINKLASQPIVISDDKIQSYYAQHENEFHTPEQISINYLQLSINDLITKIQPEEAALKNFYNENSISYSAPARWKLDAILIPTTSSAKLGDEVLKKAKQGTDFAELMRENPVISKPKVKFLGNWAAADVIPAEWQSSLVTLNKPGKVSEAINTPAGTIILKVVAYDDPKVQPYTEIKKKVRETYIHQQAEEKFAEIKEKLANLTYEHPESLEVAAKELNLPIKKSAVFTRDKGTKDVSANANVRAAAFSHEVLEQQNNSDVIQINPETVIVLRINTHMPASLLQLTAVKQQIEDKLKMAEIEQITLLTAKEIVAKLQTKNSVEHTLAWKTLGFTGRHSNKVEPAILNAAFAMPAPQDNKSNYNVIKLPEGFAIIELKAVKQGGLDVQNRSQYKVFAEQFQNTQGLMEYELYKQSQMDHSKIVIQ